MRQHFLSALLFALGLLVVSEAQSHGPSIPVAPDPASTAAPANIPPPVVASEPSKPIAAPTPAEAHGDHGAPTPAEAHAGHGAPTPAEAHGGHGAPTPADAHAGHGAPTPADAHTGHGAPTPAEAHAGHGAPTPAEAHAGHGASAPVDGHGMGHGLGHGDGAVMQMAHPGLPIAWIVPSFLMMLAMVFWGIRAPLEPSGENRGVNLAEQPIIGGFVNFINRTPWPLTTVKLIAVPLYLLVIAAGLFGTEYPERNLATSFVWNFWWPLVVVSVFFIGSAWCAICPWDTLSSWLVRGRLWRRRIPHPGLNLKVPLWMRNVWPALLMFMGLTWLELGVGVTSIPKATALMGLVMLVLSVIFLLVFERKAFCRYACPVGRTMGFYARLAPIAVRPVDQKFCDHCKTMECYNGSEEIEPCPTHLTVGRFGQNTYCLSCGNCMLSCPYKNVSWRLRPMGSEAKSQAKPHADAAWFMLSLLGITSFHGLTMMGFWEEWVVAIGGFIGESGQLVISFSLGMFGGFFAPVVVYAVCVGLTLLLAPRGIAYKRLFIAFPFSALPLAFVYHLAHNMDHLLREGSGLLALITNPFGVGLAPLTSMERHEQMMNLLFSQNLLFTIQSGLMVLGFWLALQILRHRGRGLGPNNVGVSGWRLIPMIGFISLITAGNFWLLAQDMVMRF